MALLVGVLVALAGCSFDRDVPALAPVTPAAPSGPVPVEFDVPAGFAEVDGYRIVVPLHPLRTTRWVAPAGTRGFDVIAVTSYVLDADASIEPEDRMVARIARYAEVVAATTATPPVRATVAGFPAWQQTLEQPHEPAPLVYDATFVFAGNFLVQVICQYDERPDQIRTGCRTVLDTLRIVFV